MLSLLISWKSSQPLHHMPSLVSSIERNHSSPFITHLSISVNHCPDDFIPLLSQLRTSPVKSHCKCTSRRKNLSDGKCQSDCQLVGASPPLSLLKVKGFVLCAKTYKHSDFVHSSDGECPHNYVLCGRDSRYFLCFPKSRQCPLNHLFFSEKSLNLGPSYSTFLLGEQFRLYFTNSQTEFPLLTTDFQLAFHREICIDTTQALLPFYHYKFWQYEYFFPEDGCPTKISSELSYLDNRYIYLASQPFKDLLYSNGLEDYSKNYNLDIFEYFDEKEDEFEIDIMYRPRIHYNSNCLVPDGSPATSLFTLLENADSSKTVSMITGSFLMLLLTSILGFTGIILKNFCSRKRTRRKMMMWILSAIILIFSLTLIPVITLLRQVKKVDHSFFQEKLRNGVVCGDRFVHAIIHSVVFGYRKTRSITIALIFFIIFACISWVVFVAFKILSTEDEYDGRTVSDRENSMKTVYVMGTITENERYTNDREGSTKDNALQGVDDDEEETWHDNRIASYIPQKIYIDDDALNSEDSEIVGRPTVKSRILGVSQTIGKKDKMEEEDDYFRRKQKRKKKNKKLQKRLGKQKGFELINTSSSKGKQLMREEDSFGESQMRREIKAELPEKYQTITIMSPNQSMDESKLIGKKINLTKAPKKNQVKKSEIFLKSSVINSEQKERIIQNTPQNKRSTFNFNVEPEKGEEKQKKMDLAKSQLEEPLNLFKNNQGKPKRTVGKRTRNPVSRKDKQKADAEKKVRMNPPSDTEKKDKLERKSRVSKKTESSLIGKSILSKKVQQPQEMSFDVSQEPENISLISKPDPIKSPRNKSNANSNTEKDSVNSRPLRRSRRSRYEKSVYSSSSSNNEKGLLFGNKNLRNRQREKSKQKEGKVSRKSRRPKKDGNLFSALSRD